MQESQESAVGLGREEKVTNTETAAHASVKESSQHRDLNLPDGAHSVPSGSTHTKGTTAVISNAAARIPNASDSLPATLPNGVPLCQATVLQDAQTLSHLLPCRLCLYGDMMPSPCVFVAYMQIEA